MNGGTENCLQMSTWAQSSKNQANYTGNAGIAGIYMRIFQPLINARSAITHRHITKPGVRITNSWDWVYYSPHIVHFFLIPIG